MASEVVETVFRFKANAAVLRELAGEVGKLEVAARRAQTEGLNKLAAGMSPFAAGAVLGGAVLGWFAAATAAVKIYTTAMIGLTKSAAENADELHKVGLITDEQAEAAKRAGASIEALDTTWKLLSFTLAEDVGPSVQATSTLLVAAGLAAADAMRQIHAGAALLGGGAALAASVVLGGHGGATMRTLQAAGIGAGAALESAGYLDQAEQLIRSLARSKEAHKETAGAVKAHAGEIRKLREEVNGLNTGLMLGDIDTAGGNAGNIGLIRGMTNPGETAANRGGEAGVLAALGAQTGRNQGAQQGQNAGLVSMAAQHRQTATEIVGIWTSAASSITGAMSGFFDGNTRAQKAWALVSIAINTAVAIMQAFATYGPTPVGYAAAASMGIVGAVQFAAAAAGKMGGKASGGGLGAGALTPAMPANASFSPGAQAGQSSQGGGGQARSRGGEVTIRTIGGDMTSARNLIDELRRAGVALRMA